MGMIDQRAALERLIETRQEEYAGLSRLLGRNSTYVQQFIKRGSPRRLHEDDLRTLARYFGVSVADLGGQVPEAGHPASGMIRIPRLDVGASAGHGALNDGERAISHLAFEEGWLRRLSRSPSQMLSFIRVEGDSMVPTLADGDDILVDRGDALDRLRDGIYVLRRDDTLMVKRIAQSPAARAVTIKSDNPAYPEWPNCDLATLEIIGRVIWTGRRVG